ncbi:Uncharacterised protein [Serratia entomophila]|uniref:SefI n=2 Tax=Serratia entomophila TaxID=42906 RepID=Q7BQT1_9GAMM|nr:MULTISPECIES: SefI [Serratia]AAR13155.1 SefI [Serratia entomophila]UIW20841.1 hypothetical protein KHA73_24320 [Serratia entomophila]ULG11134.1 SefI [Serratia entomophila]ULG11457.1 SefI [Serratia entomophila]ULG12246.1 SefI [Serratia entomophila]
MQLRHYMPNINNILMIGFIFLFKATQAQAVDLYRIEYGSGGVVTISKGEDYDSDASSGNNWNYCGSLNKATLSISNESSYIASSSGSANKKQIGTTNGNSNGNCLTAVGSLFPVTTSFIGKVNSVCVSGGTILDHFKGSMRCYGSSDFTSSIKDATCDISSGDITLDYGTILSDEVDGKSISTNATISCTGGSSQGEVSVALSLGDENVNLKNDNSLYAQLNLDGNGKSTTATIDINGSTNISLTSTLHTNGNVSSGAFSGSSVLTMTYY